MVESLGVAATIREVAVDNPEQAPALRFFGSPTIQVNGQDIDPAMRHRTDYSYSCRMYEGDGIVPRALLERALQEAGRTSGKVVAA